MAIIGRLRREAVLYPYIPVTSLSRVIPPAAAIQEVANFLHWLHQIHHPLSWGGPQRTWTQLLVRLHQRLRTSGLTLFSVRDTARIGQ